MRGKLLANIIGGLILAAGIILIERVANPDIFSVGDKNDQLKIVKIKEGFLN